MTVAESIVGIKSFVKHLTNEGRYKSFDEKITAIAKRRQDNFA